LLDAIPSQPQDASKQEPFLERERVASIDQLFVEFLRPYANVAMPKSSAEPRINLSQNAKVPHTHITRLSAPKSELQAFLSAAN